MLELSEGRWTEIRQIAYQDELEPVSLRVALKEVLLHYQHLEKQIKLLADYIMSERPDDPAWSLGEDACAMAVEIMRRNANSRIEQKIDALTEKFDRMIAEAHQTKVDLQMTRNMIESAEKDKLVQSFPPFKIGK